MARAPGLALAALLVALATLAQPVRSQETPTTRIEPQGPQYGFPDPDRPERFVWVFLGGVEVHQPGRRLRADTLVAVVDTSGEPPQPTGAEAPAGVLIDDTRLIELYLDGNVSVEEGDERISGASAFQLDNRTGVATIVEGELRTTVHRGQPLVIRYEILRRLQDGSAEIAGLTYTTCEYGQPHWHIRTPAATLQPTPDGRILKTAENTVLVGPVPVLMWPGYDVNLDRDRLLIHGLHIGHSSRFGTEIETDWEGDASPFATGVAGLFGYEGSVQAEWDLDLDHYSKRGWFFEPGIRYQTGSSSGLLFGSYIRDQEDEDDLGIPIEDDTRGRIDLAHRTRVGEHGILDIEVSRQSDANYLNEYYEREAREGKEQETYVTYREVVDNQARSVLASTRLNDFDTQVEYLPRLEGRQAGLMLPGGLFMTAREFADNARLLPDDDGGLPSVRNARAGVGVDLTWPVDLPNGDRVQVLGGIDLTGFEDTVAYGSELRSSGTAGVEWSRVYTGSREASSETWNIDGLRHIVQPRLGYWNRSVSLDPDELLQIDQVETLDDEARFELGVRDRIQTHQDGRVVTILDVDLALPYYPQADRDNDGRAWGLVLLDTAWRPGADLPLLRDATLQWRTEFDADRDHWQESFARFSTSFGRGRRLQLSNDKAFREFDFRTVALEQRLNERWSVAVFYQEDVLLGETARSGILLRQLAHCWYIDLELSTRRGEDINGASDDETRIALRMRPAFLDPDEDLTDPIGHRIP
jgi:hypothetical protein